MPADDDPFRAALDAIAEGWERAARASQQVVDGSYAGDDAADDVAWVAGRLLDSGRELAACWAGLLADLVRGPGPDLPPSTPTVPTPNPRITLTVPDHLTARPITLDPPAFRAIGWGGQYDIGAGAVTLTQPVLTAGVSTFVVSVSSAGLPHDARSRTIVYEGRVTEAQTGGLVVGPIRFVKPAE